MKPDIAPFAIPYNEYRYLYSPRPKTQCPSSDLKKYDDGTYIAQAKPNGSNVLVFMNGSEVKVMNRHNEQKTKCAIDFSQTYSGTGWMVLNGEVMEKSKRDETGTIWNGQFLIFDILVYNGYILTGSTTTARIGLLAELFGSDTMRISNTGALLHKPYLYTTPVDNVWRIVSYENTFTELFNDMTKIEYIEGLVLKKKQARLDTPFNELSNFKWQMKCRKETKIYKY